jgi:pimeloyl-ACP methyl ester carboxylesterase
MLRKAWVAVLLAAAQTGCGFRHLTQDIDTMRHTALVTGRVRVPSPRRGPIYVSDFVDDENVKKRVGAEQLQPDVTEYGFLVDTNERHYVVAFQDTSGDHSWEPGEPIGALAEGFVVAARQERTLPDVVLDPKGTVPSGFNLDLRKEVFHEALQIARGEVTTLDNPMFSPEESAKGMWEPITAAEQIKIGIYLLQEYDPKKTPVLFVHGINGSPREFRNMIAALDARRYQAWVMFYPSGLRLGRIAHGVALGLQTLRDRLHPPHLVVAAHSMGGLVARAAVLELARARQGDWIEALITLSTPYDGDPGAGKAARFASEAVASLIDLSTGSEFLQSIQTPLPKTIPFYLFFTIGGRSGLGGENNDGVISVSSELPIWAQDDATRIFGYDVGHTDVLTDPSSIRKFESILDGLP